MMAMEEGNGRSNSSSMRGLPLLSLNHVSLLCASVPSSARFYQEVLGFVLIKRPSSFKFDGAWLYNYGIGVHLIEKPSVGEITVVEEPRPINPKDNHISFQCTDVGFVKKRLEDMGMKYVTAVVEDDNGIKVDQVFFHDPDGYMIEICNCDNIPILPISSCPLINPGPKTIKKPTPSPPPPAPPSTGSRKCGFMEETALMESLSVYMMNFSF